MTATGQSENPLRILLVDDSPEALMLTEEMLQELGFTHISTAADGALGLETINSRADADPVELVLCDWNMPEMTGLELLEKVREHNKDLLFIMMTGQADDTSVAEARALGISGFLNKPFSPDDVRKKVGVAARIITHRGSDAAD